MGMAQTATDVKLYEAHELEEFCAMAIHYLSTNFELFAIQPELAMSQEMEWTMDKLWVRMKQEVMGEDLEGILVLKAPLNWWEHVKERWMPDRLKKRWPVKYREAVYNARVLYPWIPKGAGVIWIKVSDTADGPKLYWDDDAGDYTEEG